MEVNARELKKIGPYTVRRFIAEGGMAWVFEVADPTFEGRRLALKMLKPEAAAGEEFSRFESEARLQATIDHPNLVTIFDFGHDAETQCHYYTMTLVEGPTIAQRVSEGGPLGVKEAGRLFLDLLDGLDALHKRGIVHRDIKPANVLIDERGRARVADLGIARVQEETSRTRTGMAVGTVIYMSPEQARGKRVAPSSDVFSVGLTLYEALTGRIVYEGIEDVDSTNSHDILGYLVSLGRTGNEIDISYPRETQIPARLRKVVEKACSFHAEDRYADAGEMAEAIEEALQPRQEIVREGPKLPVLIGGGVGVLAIAAFAGYVGIYRPMMEKARLQEDATRQLELSKALKDSVPTLLDRAKDLNPLPSRELLRSADQLVERAAYDFVRGNENVEAEHFQQALGFFDASVDAYEDVCRKLTDGHLTATANAKVERAQARESELREAGAPDYVPEPWQALTAMTARLAAPVPEIPCAKATAQLDRIDGAGVATLAMVRVEQNLTEVWPRLARAGRNEALTAQKLAEAEDVDDPAYRKARDAGRRALEQGEQSERAEQYLPARYAYGKASEQFKAAAAISPAAKARAEVRRLEQEVARTGAGVAGRVSVLVSRADGAYARDDWAQARELYTEAVKGIKGALHEGELQSETLVARSSALSTREVAIREGAEKSAAAPLGRGDAARDKATTALDDKRYDEAEREFQAAQVSYAEARDAAIEAIGAAREAEVAARSSIEALGAREDCSGLESSTGRQDCESGLADLAKGATALAAGDAPAALRSLRVAREAIERARGSESQFLASKPYPPELVKRTPQREKLEIHRNQSQKFLIEARDRNRNDRLTYAWTFQGSPVRSPGTELTLEPQESGEVTVTVSDGRDSFTEHWQVEVKNRKPKLSLTPTSRSIALAVGQSKEFRASFSDPDGDPVSAVFLLDGREVTRGERYRFAARKVGAHKLEVVAEDSAGARTVLARTISVAKAAPPPPPVTRPPPPPPVRPPPPPPDNRPPPAQWEAGVRSALTSYEQALNAKSMRELEQVWLLPADSLYRLRWKSKFDRAEALDVSVEILSMDKKGEQVTVVFNQREATPSKTRTWKYEAILGLRGGDWQIMENKLKR